MSFAFFWNSVDEEFLDLESVHSLNENLKLCFIDPSGNEDNPGSLIINLLAWIKFRYDVLHICVFCLRNELFASNDESKSLQITIRIPENANLTSSSFCLINLISRNIV